MRSRSVVGALLVGVALLAAALSGCTFTRRAETPMARIRYTSLGASSARGAIVLLPGIGDRPETFAEQGFLAALRREAPDYEIIAADAHYGYYRTRSLVERLEHDVIGPLRREGYRELWLVGTSLGGFGAIGYARQYPERIAGLLLFAPYLGPRGVVDEVRRTGLCKYQAQASTLDDQEAFARKNFAYLSRAACSPGAVDLWLSVGRSDHLFPASEAVGRALAPDHFLVLPGGHGWRVWTPAIDQLAARSFRPAER